MENKPTTVLTKDIQKIEIECLLLAIQQCYGYDFRDYSRASLTRRIVNHMQKEHVSTISELIPLLLYDKSKMSAFLDGMSIAVTEMFRTPAMFRKLREHIIPKLRTYPRINIWNIGCATGEEPYSMAILLEEENLLQKCRIYATDFNPRCLEVAKKGIYNLRCFEDYEKNYLAAGGQKKLTDYTHQRHQSFLMNQSIRDKVTFAHHNLMLDGRFAEMHLIFCRNVMIYFNPELQNRVLSLINASLINRGFLVLGDKESLINSDYSPLFETLAAQERIYRKRSCIDA